MKFLLLSLLFLCNSLSSQVKSFKLYGNQQLNVIYSTLNMYATQNDSIRKTSYGIYSDSLIRMGDIKLKSVEKGSSQFSTLNIEDFDTDFNLLAELKDKVYFVNRGNAMDFYYIENDSIWVHKTLQKQIVWHLLKEEYAPFYKIDLGNKRFVYWANSSGLIFKKGGVLKTNFKEFEYYYPDTTTHFVVVKKDSVNMKYGYFDYGGYKVELANYNDLFGMDTSYDNSGKYRTMYPKQNFSNYLNSKWKYTITKNGKVILKGVDLKYFNEKTLIAYNENSLYYYNSKMGLDSQFNFRAKYQSWSEIEFLVNNKIKKMSLVDLVLAIPDTRLFVCGTVTHYKMQIRGNSIIEFVNGEMVNQKPYSKTIEIQSLLRIDSMSFMNATKEMNWSDNGGFDNRIILYKDGKCGLYKFEVKDSIMTLFEMLPQELDKIYLVNNLVIVNKKNHEDIIDYYLLNKKMRFINIMYANSVFLRYKMSNNSMGWISPGANLYEDL